MEDDLYGIGPMITHDLPIIRQYNAVTQRRINARAALERWAADCAAEDRLRAVMDEAIGRREL